MRFHLFQTTLIFTLSQYKLPTYGRYAFPEYAAILGWFIAAIPMVPMVIMMVLAIYRENGNLLQVGDSVFTEVSLENGNGFVI